MEYTRGAQIIAEERQRQIVEEGFTPEHDAAYDDDGDLVAAAICLDHVFVSDPQKGDGR